MAFYPAGLGPPTAEDLELAKYYQWVRRRAEDWFIKTRANLGHSRLDFQVVVLKPLCDDCCVRLRLRTLAEHVLSGKRSEIVILLPEEVLPERFRLYDGVSKCLHLWPPAKPYREPHRISCSMCSQTVSAKRGDDIIRVIEEPFADYFGFPEEGPKRKRGKAERRKIAERYGFRCFECRTLLDENNLTLDHVVSRSKGGPTVSLNLQALCGHCNQEKANLPVESVKIALDMLLRPAPSDSYSYPIW